jgi:hypothetical protein
MNFLRTNSTTIKNKKNLSQISDLRVMFNKDFTYCCALYRQASPTTSAELYCCKSEDNSCLVPSGDAAMMGR